MMDCNLRTTVKEPSTIRQQRNYLPEPFRYVTVSHMTGEGHTEKLEEHVDAELVGDEAKVLVPCSRARTVQETADPTGYAHQSVCLSVGQQPKANRTSR